MFFFSSELNSQQFGYNHCCTISTLMADWFTLYSLSSCIVLSSNLQWKHNSITKWQCSYDEAFVCCHAGAHEGRGCSPAWSVSTTYCSSSAFDYIIISQIALQVSSYVYCSLNGERLNPEDPKAFTLHELVSGLRPLVVWMSNSLELLQFIQFQLPLILECRVQKEQGQYHEGKGGDKEMENLG